MQRYCSDVQLNASLIIIDMIFKWAIIQNEYFPVSENYIYYDAGTRTIFIAGLSIVIEHI